jgi:hypothetical protein
MTALAPLPLFPLARYTGRGQATDSGGRAGEGSSQQAHPSP